MQLKDTKVSIVVELAIPDDLVQGQDVTVTLTDGHGPKGWQMGRVAGTVPNVIAWLSTVYGLVNEDILSDYIPSFQLEDLIP